MLAAAAVEPPAAVCIAAAVSRPGSPGPCRALPALRQELASRVFQQLGWNWARAGGILRTDPSLFYDEKLQRRGGAWCLVYRMKAPFSGEMAHCGAAPFGTVGYAPGILSWTAAGQRICELVAAETGTPCANNGVEILQTALRRDAGGTHYRVEARRHVRDRPELAEPGHVPVEYENRVYRLAPDGSRFEALARTRQLCGRSCRPLP